MDTHIRSHFSATTHTHTKPVKKLNDNSLWRFRMVKRNGKWNRIESDNQMFLSFHRNTHNPGRVPSSGMRELPNARAISILPTWSECNNAHSYVEQYTREHSFIRMELVDGFHFINTIFPVFAPHLRPLILLLLGISLACIRPILRQIPRQKFAWRQRTSIEHWQWALVAHKSIGVWHS